MLLHASESTLPRAPWDDGVCKVCGMDKDDDSVLLCDVCDSEYHTYCLDPPLARIPEGNWYCPSCVAAKVTYRSARGTQIVNRCKKNTHRGEFVDNILDGLTKLSLSMELKEYWEFTVEEVRLLTDSLYTMSCGFVNSIIQFLVILFFLIRICITWFSLFATLLSQHFYSLVCFCHYCREFFSSNSCATRH